MARNNLHIESNCPQKGDERSSSSIFRVQWDIVKQDKWLLSCLTWLPCLLAFSIWAIFSQGIARDLPIGIVDLQHTQLSRTLTQDFDASPTLKVAHSYADVAQAKRAMVEQKIYGYIIIPSNFDESIYRKLTPQVSIFYNSQFILIAKLINSAAIQVQSTFNAKLDVGRYLAKGDSTLSSALGNAVSVRTQITPLFNRNSSYAQFLVTAIVPALWQIMMIVTTILILAANLRTIGLTNWVANQPYRFIINTMTPYVPIFLLFGIGFLTWFYIGLKWPLNGNLLILVFAQFATVIASIIMGCFFFFLTLDPARAMSFAGAFTAPSFAFMGITFPVINMNPLAQAWRDLLPVSHYIEVQVAQTSYGANMLDSMVTLLPILGYFLPAIITIIFVKRHLQLAQPVHQNSCTPNRGDEAQSS